uniref:RRM domain-containing protein n=1 Tax=Nelumbo nucifera TaxID=4432 RepID=A0A822XRS5_NELNU|nr:TPA_asm: hypothetical protein HUJ06_022948 [Nelumbo nucifera]
MDRTPESRTITIGKFPASQEEVRTLFITGLPGDVKPRKIYNLFREFPGYQSSKLRNSTRSSQLLKH